MSIKMTGKLILEATLACLAAAPLFSQKIEPMTAEQTVPLENLEMSELTGIILLS